MFKRDKKVESNQICPSKALFWGLLLTSFAATLKCIFVSLQMDEEYAISLSYRLLLNDRLFTEIWDPHQTSAFLIQFFIWLYMKITGTTTYVVIFVRFVGTIIHGLVAYYLYRCLCYETKREYAFYLSLVYFSLLPKTYIMPEFSNMMVWALTMLLLCLSRLVRLEKQEAVWNRKMLWACVEAGFWICFMVLSYPSCIIIYPFIVWYLWKYSTYKKQTIGIVTSVCVASGLLYILWLLSYMNVSELVANIQSLVASCGSHGDGIGRKLEIYGFDIGCLIVFGGGYIIASLVLRYFILRKRNEATSKQEKIVEWMFIFLITAFLLQFIHWILMLWEYESSYPFTSYFFIFGFAFYCVKKSDGATFDTNQKQMISLWLWGNIVMYIAILMLTNLTLFTSIKYLMPGVVVAVLALIKYAEKNLPEVSNKWAKPLLITWCFVAIFVKGWAYTDDDGLMKNITCVRNIISEGPAKGIFTEYMQGYMQESIYEELHTYVQPGEKRMVVDSHTLCYLYQHVEVASPITICTPTFDENLLDYWERNPDKYPDVVAIRCWYGELMWKEGWVTQWLDEEYEASQVIDGKYMRYYIR